jgi:lysozyme
MQMSQEGIDALLKKYEGCKLKAYRCPANICTIGYGHTSAAGAPIVLDGMTLTQKQCDDILRKDLVKFETAVHDMVTQPLNQHQFDVLVDFAYNAGVGNLKTSTLLKKVNGADFDAVPAELMKWTKGGGKVLPGLVKRRQAESAWWVSDNPIKVSINSEEPSEHEHEQRVEPDSVPIPSMANSSQGNAALITAGLGGLGVAKEVAAQAQEASETADQLMGLLHNPNFIIMAAIIGLAGAAWYFRKKHMDQHGV